MRPILTWRETVDSGRNVNYDIISDMTIYVLVLDGVFDIGLASLLDVIGMAQELAIDGKSASLKIKSSMVAVSRNVFTAHGLRVPVMLPNSLPPPDVVLIPAIGSKTPQTLLSALERDDVQRMGIWIKKWAGSGALIGAACTGTFVLAETGLLKGEKATTSWWLSALFRQRYPQVELEETQMLVNSSRFITAGAAIAHLDLGLGIIRGRSPMLASLCARYLLIEPRESQAAFVIPNHIAHSDPLVERFERWSRARLAQGFSMQDAVRTLGTSERTLARRLNTVMGKSPLAYFQDLRVERAVHLLQTTNQTIDEIATMVGYSDAVTLRTLLRRKLGKGIRELRRRYSQRLGTKNRRILR
jgi:transcriptional regulator GlxA family with amidase domain